MTRLVLATRDSPFARHLAARLAAEFDLCGVLIFERPPPSAPGPPQRVRRRVRRALRRLAVLAGDARARIEAIEERLQVEADRFFLEQAGDPPPWPADAPLRRSPDLNDEETVGWAASRRPELLAMAGGPILRAPMLSVPRLGALNMHSSLLPAYRGTQAEFWQAHDRDLEALGVTIHFIDEGVDTGAIVMAEKTAAPALEDPWRLRARNLLAALELYPRAVRAAADGGAPRIQAEGGRAFRKSDITIEARARVLRNVGALPASDGAGPA